MKINLNIVPILLIRFCKKLKELVIKIEKMNKELFSYINKKNIL
jgi:hypothetical protein